MVVERWGLRSPKKITEKQTRSMLGDFGKVSKRFKTNTSMKDFGAECFEFDLESNGINRVKENWSWEDFQECSGAYQVMGADPFNNPVPNIVSFMWNDEFFNPDYFVTYWTQTEDGAPYLKNKFVEVKGSRSIKNGDLNKYIKFNKRCDRHNEKIRLYAKAPFRNRCLIEFEIVVYPNAYATGIQALNKNKEWKPTKDHLDFREIYTVEELIDAFDESTQLTNLESRHIFDPKRVRQINQHSTWSDRLYKKYI